MIQLDTVLIKAASRCNINCSYCYVYNMGDSGWITMPKQLSNETILALGKALGRLSGAQQRPFAVVLHGGEPLLLGFEKLRLLLRTLRAALSNKYPLSIQTNGTLITDGILDVCAEYETSLGVSLDGPRHINNRHRVDHKGRDTHDEVLRGLERLRKHRDADVLCAGLLAVIDPTSDPSEVYSFFKQLGVSSVDFLYRDGNHSQLPYGKASFHSNEYGRWLSKLLDIYLDDPAPIRIRLLDDLIKLALGRSGTKEGIGNTPFAIMIIDTDGSITKNDTLKSNFNGADRFDTHWSVHTDDLSEVANSQEFAEYHALQRPTAAACLGCPELRICGGGMPVNRWCNDNGYNNPSVYCADQLFLIAHIRKRISSLMSTQSI